MVKWARGCRPSHGALPCHAQIASRSGPRTVRERCDEACLPVNLGDSTLAEVRRAAMDPSRATRACGSSIRDAPLRSDELVARRGENIFGELHDQSGGDLPAMPIQPHAVGAPRVDIDQLSAFETLLDL